MRIMPLVILLLISAVLVVPCSVAGSTDDEMLKKSQNLNVTVPQKGNAVLGTQYSMTQMTDWLNACSDAIISFVNDVMNMLGVGNTTYTHDMTKTLQQGTNLSKVMTKK
jgi:hypothetical protein